MSSTASAPAVAPASSVARAALKVPLNFGSIINEKGPCSEKRGGSLATALNTKSIAFNILVFSLAFVPPFFL